MPLLSSSSGVLSDKHLNGFSERGALKSPVSDSILSKLLNGKHSYNTEIPMPRPENREERRSGGCDGNKANIDVALGFRARARLEFVRSEVTRDADAERATGVVVNARSDGNRDQAE